MQGYYEKSMRALQPANVEKISQKAYTRSVRKFTGYNIKSLFLTAVPPVPAPFFPAQISKTKAHLVSPRWAFVWQRVISFNLRDRKMKDDKSMDCLCSASVTTSVTVNPPVCKGWRSNTKIWHHIKNIFHWHPCAYEALTPQPFEYLAEQSSYQKKLAQDHTT